MLVSEAIDWHGAYREQGVFICFAGQITDVLIASLTKTLQENMSRCGVDEKTKSHISFVFIELSQNIIRYSSEISEEIDGESDSRCRYGTLFVGRDQETYFVASSNAVENPQVDALRSMLTLLQGADRQTVKAMYKKARRSDPPEGSKGAGLGLYEIALRASRDLEFAFEARDETSSYFAIKAII